ncbi:hypothetical protein SAMD00019534_093850, partial [Acytostelium subglobosum LB1]|uniref:hypothetical protein n=1 Tax=Acytostelium subglobosum LB1 TaxID=1410327 RepID=UPI0006450FE6
MTSKRIKVEELYRAKWVAMNRITFLDPNKREVVWEAVDRTTRVSDVDGVDIIAIIGNGTDNRRIVLTIQYRPPVDSLVIEFPAGLLDKGETPEQAALRELHEETGYTCDSVNTVSSILTLEPGMSSANTKYCIVNVDGEKNKEPKQKLEEDEFIEVLILPLDNLMRSLEELRVKYNCLISSQVYSLALGLSLASPK